MKPSAVMQGWLQTTTPITDKAKSLCHHVSLKLLNERWEKRNGTSLFVREILILCDEKPAWYAETLIPQTTYTHREAQFNSLNTCPINIILFNDPAIIREPFIYAYLLPENKEYQQAVQHVKNIKPLSLWARKSVFRIDDEPLSIMEVFFHDVLEDIQESKI